MEVAVEKVTPSKAEKWLNEHNNTNRTLREGVAEQYARDMINGHWTECPDPIVFYDDGDLANGQHRLYAIVESKTTQTFTIHRGLPRSAGLNMDTGLGRSVVDNGRISGADMGLSTVLVSTARSVALGQPSAGRMSNSEKLELVEAHRDACSWAINALPHAKNIFNGVILGALARAWYHEHDHVRLAEYAQVVGTGFAKSEDDSAAVAMRNYMLQHAGVSTSSAMWRDSFMKAMNSIQYFMQRKKLTYIKTVKEEVYPLKKKRLIKT